MSSFPQNAALILIDIQKGFDDPVWGRRNNPAAETRIATLLHAWRRSGRPIFHIQHLSQIPHSPLRADSPGGEIKDMVRPLDGEPVLQKRVNSAFIGTDLEERLRRADISTLIITGLTTNHCVETTTRMAGNLGFHTYLVSDATATFDRRGPDNVLHSAEDIQAMTLTNLHEEFATIVTTSEVLQGLA
ncbi:MAG: cysteine hydrolase [Chloroflexota bacterium]|nr:cysteine hydrolase [Chloroflexota bacterium]